MDDELRPFERSGDPMLATLTQQLSGITVGQPETARGKLKPMLENEGLFGVNLYAVGLGDRVEALFRALIAGRGAVRATLAKYLRRP